MACPGFDKILTLDHDSLAFPFFPFPALSFAFSHLLGIFKELCFISTYQQPTYRERYVTGVLQPGEPNCTGRIILLISECSTEPAGAAEHSFYLGRACS